MSAAQRNRGAACERAVVNFLRANGYPDARRYLAGDGRQPGDIDAIPGVAIEVKDRASSAWPTWREQALTEAGWRIPVVVRRTRGVTDVGSWLCQVRRFDFHNFTDDDARVVSCARTLCEWHEVRFGAVLDALGHPLFPLPQAQQRDALGVVTWPTPAKDPT